MVTRVRGPMPAGACCPQRSLAREASTLSLVTCHAGSSRRGIDPVGETYIILDTPLGTRHLVPCRSPSPRRRQPWSSQVRSRRSQPSQDPSKPPAKPGGSRQRSIPIPVPASAAPLQAINPDAAGIDVHSDMHMACVPAATTPTPSASSAQTPPNLHEIVAWLKGCRIKTVALESTGVYWIPLLETPGIGGTRGQAGGAGAALRTAGLAPRPTSWTPSGSNACTPTACCAGRSTLSPDWVLALRPTGGCGRCRSATPPAMSSTCRRPWRR